ncbi:MULTISPECIES: hypothetical protein [unclassified Streptomyces]|uniref:hypothetical protein n=1 Tax=unclassified Streptomyces TaxID=2593676 RepID=UPI0033BCB168
MVRRRWAAAMGLVACLLMLHLVVPAFTHSGSAAEGAVTAAAAWDAEAEAAGEPCPCEEEPSDRQPAARAPRAAGAAGAGAVVTGAPAVDRGGTDLRAAGTARRPGAVGAARNAVELQTFRC